MKLTSEQRKSRNSALFIPVIATVVAAALIVLGLFLPISSADEEFEELVYLAEDLAGEVGEDFDPEDYLSFSLFKLYNGISETSDNVFETIMFVIFFLSPMIMALIIMAFAALKKPIAVMISDAIAFLLYLIPVSIVSSALDEVKNNPFQWGFAYYLHYIAFALVLICAVWMLISKSSFEKGLKASEPAPVEPAAEN